MNTDTINTDNFWILVIAIAFAICLIWPIRKYKKDSGTKESELNAKTRYKMTEKCQNDYEVFFDEEFKSISEEHEMFLN